MWHIGKLLQPPSLFLLWLMFYLLIFVVALSIKSSLKQDETVAGKVAAEWTGPSELEYELTDVACRHSVVNRGESECKVQQAKQLVVTSPVTMKCSVDRPIRTESTESVNDWVNRTRLMGFLPILNEKAGENTEISPHSQTRLLTNSCLWVLWHFFPAHTQKSYWCLPKVTYCSFNMANIKTNEEFQMKNT